MDVGRVVVARRRQNASTGFLGGNTEKWGIEASTCGSAAINGFLVGYAYHRRCEGIFSPSVEGLAGLVVTDVPGYRSHFRSCRNNSGNLPPNSDRTQESNSNDAGVLMRPRAMSSPAHVRQRSRFGRAPA